MAGRVKVYEEETKQGQSIAAWLLPLLLLLALPAYFLTRHKGELVTNAATDPAVQTASAGTYPDLGTVHFDTDRATLTPEGQATLQQAAAAMKGNPNVHLRLEGFTDSTGDHSHPATLSQQRAATVTNYLKSQGVDGNRLTGRGFSSAKPVDANATAAGKADHRRVELFSQR